MVRALPPLPRRPLAQRRTRGLGIAWLLRLSLCRRWLGGEAAGDGQPLAELTGSRVRRTFDDVEVADISLEDYIAVKVRATAR